MLFRELVANLQGDFILVTLATDGVDVDSNQPLSICLTNLKTKERECVYVAGGDAVGAQQYTNIDPVKYKDFAKPPAAAYAALKTVLKPDSILVGYSSIRFTEPFFNRFVGKAESLDKYRWLDLMILARGAVNRNCGRLAITDDPHTLTLNIMARPYDKGLNYSLRGVSQQLDVKFEEDLMDEMPLRNADVSSKLWDKIMGSPVA